MNREKKKIELSTTIIIAGILAVVGYICGTQSSKIEALLAPTIGLKGDYNKLDLSSVENTYRKLTEKFDGKLDKNKLIEGASKGLVEAAGDDYTTYLNKEESEDFSKNLNGDVGAGIGVELGSRKNLPTVIRTLKNNSAIKAGIMAGDIVTKVNDEDVKKLKVGEISQKIRGEEGTTVKITVLRGDKEKEFSVVRAKIDNPSVELNIKGDVAILNVARFDENTGNLANKYAEEIKAKNINKVILDLRNNGGGYVSAARSLASLWIDRNSVIVTEKQGDKVVGQERASGNNILKDKKTVVLINGNTASASEIVAGALKDYAKATIVGEKSFGKGSVQEPIQINDDALLKVTVAKWYTPKGKNINKEGIHPEKEVKLTEDDVNNSRDPQLDYALDTLK